MNGTEHGEKPIQRIAAHILSMPLPELVELTRYGLAEHFGFHVSHLSRLFRRETGGTVLQFITREKLRRAGQLLKSRQDLTIAEISCLLGWQKCEQFRRKFSRYYLLTPQQFRRLVRVGQLWEHQAAENVLSRRNPV